MTTSARRDEISGNVADVRARIAEATVRAGRLDPPQLVVVTKTYPASDIAILAELGVRDIAENRDQEAKAKFEECRELDLRWHMIGQVQRKKASSVLTWADMVETVDRPELAVALDRAALAQGKVLEVLVQISLDVPIRTDRGGVQLDQLDALVDLVGECPGLSLTGVMAVAPYPGDPDEAFGRLDAVVQRLRSRGCGIEIVSAGMSDDLEAAIAHGTTQVRVGGSILGARPLVQ